MKWIVCLVVCVCVFQELAHAVQNKPTKPKEIVSIEVDSKLVIYGEDKGYLEEGTNKKITCKGSNHNRNQKIQWYDPEGNLVTRDPTKHVYVSEPKLAKVATSVLIFSNIRNSDSGVWTCKSEGLTQEISLCVMTPIAFEGTVNGTVDDVIMDAGRAITLTCTVKGNPEPSIRWYKDEKQIIDDDEKYFTCIKYSRHNIEGLLTIKSLEPEDMGDYVCEAIQETTEIENCSDIRTLNITLNVNHAPTSELSLDELLIFARDGDLLELPCYTTAYPKPDYRWFTGDMKTEISDKKYNISDDGSVSKLFLIANYSTFGEKYICKAKNEFGELYITFHILRMHRPEKLSATTDFIPRQRKIILNITSDEEIHFPVDVYEIEYFEKITIGEPKPVQWLLAKNITYFADSIEDVFEIKNVNINTEYWVRIRAVNEMGSGPWSSNILASTAYDTPQAGFFDTGVFLGIIVTAAIFVFGAACIAIVKRI